MLGATEGTIEKTTSPIVKWILEDLVVPVAASQLEDDEMSDSSVEPTFSSEPQTLDEFLESKPGVDGKTSELISRMIETEEGLQELVNELGLNRAKS